MTMTGSQDKRRVPKMSLFSYLSSEVTRGYALDHDEQRYTERRRKMYTFMKIPRELERFMSYGFFHCLDSFLFVFTFLPIRFVLAVLALICRLPLILLGLRRLRRGRVLFPAEKIDLLKGLIIALCAYILSHVDTSMMYHLIKSQSVIKLYLFYNMLEVGDRLFSAFGQDTMDALYWTATEPLLRKREHIGVVPHFLLAITYVTMHTMLVLLQATTLNVAINASNKALLTIMMSNNFVELKGSVFKKFDKNNLFQVSCSDVRERFHLFSLLFIVVVQTMKEYGWKQESFWALAPDCLLVLGAEFLVDWIKHAFITRFNEISAEVYKDYSTYLAYDLAQTKQKYAFSDHSDIVSRRMGFIPLPLGVVMIRVTCNAIRSNSHGAIVIFILAYLCLVTFRILCSVVILGKACDLIDNHRQLKKSTPEGSNLKESEDLATEKTKNSSHPTEAVTSVADKVQEVVESHKTEVPHVNDQKTNVATASFVEKIEAVSRNTSVIFEKEEDDVGITLVARLDSNDIRPTLTTHSWDNPRASKFSVDRGEFNKVVYTDSRRRPLSCTPPSTTLSKSASLDEEDPVFINKVEDIPVLNPVVTEVELEEEETSGSFLPDLLQGRLASDDVINSSGDARDDTTSEDTKTENLTTDPGTLSFGSRSMSAPDFIYSYQRPFDPEFDWPQVDGDDQVDSDVKEGPVSPVTSEFQFFPKSVLSTSRRGSGSEDRQSRSRRRYDTDRF